MAFRYAFFELAKGEFELLNLPLDLLRGAAEPGAPQFGELRQSSASRTAITRSRSASWASRSAMVCARSLSNASFSITIRRSERTSRGRADGFEIMRTTRI